MRIRWFDSGLTAKEAPDKFVAEAQSVKNSFHVADFERRPHLTRQQQHVLGASATVETRGPGQTESKSSEGIKAPPYVRTQSSRSCSVSSRGTTSREDKGQSNEVKVSGAKKNEGGSGGCDWAKKIVTKRNVYENGSRPLNHERGHEVNPWLMGGDVKSNLPRKSVSTAETKPKFERKRSDTEHEGSWMRVGLKDLKVELRLSMRVDESGGLLTASVVQIESDAVTVVTRRCPPEIELGIPSAMERATNAWRTVVHQRKTRKISHLTALGQVFGVSTLEISTLQNSTLPSR
ncbi:hypothetical protein R3P38DRAFT_2770406 [Favolaschia claudopus]|uniref:Uncharacterized protein n=1 Tax=Favolaschia claudopus TaxID=2862362 RepID=A0AAW0CH69_9AGAR